MSSADARFLTYLPRHGALSGLVAYYYVHFSDDPNHESRFEYYPHFRNAVTAYLDADLRFDDFGSVVSPSESRSFSALYTRNYSHSITVHLRGCFRKIGVAFEPLGVNRFIAKPLEAVAPSTVNNFTEFGRAFRELVQEVLSDPEEDPVSKVDDFLVGRLRACDHSVLRQAMSILRENAGESDVRSLADQLGISRKTLLRYFKKHLCCTVEEYRKLVRFRNALNDYRSQTDQITFTELAHKHSYYDQPAFIRHFKAVTGKTPRSFFAGLRQYGANDTYWSPKR